MDNMHQPHVAHAIVGSLECLEVLPFGMTLLDVIQSMFILIYVFSSKEWLIATGSFMCFRSHIFFTP